MKLYHVTIMKNVKSIKQYGLLSLTHTKGIYLTDNLKKSLEWIVSIHDLVFSNTQEKYLLVEVEYDEKLFKKWNNTHQWNSLMNTTGNEYLSTKSIPANKLKFYELEYNHDCKKYKSFKNLKNNPIKITNVKCKEIPNKEIQSKPLWKMILEISKKHHKFSKGIGYDEDSKTFEYSEVMFKDYYKTIDVKEKILTENIVKSGYLKSGVLPSFNIGVNSKYIPTKNKQL